MRWHSCSARSRTGPAGGLAIGKGKAQARAPGNWPPRRSLPVRRRGSRRPPAGAPARWTRAAAAAARAARSTSPQGEATGSGHSGRRHEALHVVLLVVDAVGRGLAAGWGLLWASLYGLTLGFVMSAVVQVLVPQRLLRRHAAGGLRGIAMAAGFGAISSYGSAAAARSLYQRGADARAAFSFLISSTNMNIAILVMFWTLVGWKFAFAELFGG